MNVQLVRCYDRMAFLRNVRGLGHTSEEEMPSASHFPTSQEHLSPAGVGLCRWLIRLSCK